MPTIPYYAYTMPTRYHTMPILYAYYTILRILAYAYYAYYNHTMPTTPVYYYPPSPGIIDHNNNNYVEF